MLMKNICLLLFIICLICSACGAPTAEMTTAPVADSDTTSLNTENAESSSTETPGDDSSEESSSIEKEDDQPDAEDFILLLTDLLNSVENPSDEDLVNIEADLELIRSVSESDYEIAESIARNWEELYLDPDYELIMHDGSEEATGLEDSGIPQGRGHAFIVLGYQLDNGEMADELKGRCDAAAAAARAFPESILVCSGGATGYNNPERHTEAGMMKDYLSNECGIDPDRIYIDERAMTTAENAANTFKILRENDIDSLTIVTSSYHLRWGEVLYNAVGAIYSQKYGYSADIISNYCYETGPEDERFLMDARFAAIQLAEILQLPEEIITELPQIEGYTPHPANIEWE